MNSPLTDPTLTRPQLRFLAASRAPGLCYRCCSKPLACEFGVHDGRSIRDLRIVFDRVVGFDSWEGLPEDWKPGFPAGTFKTTKPVIDGVVLVDGLFAESVGPWFAGATGCNHVGFVHIDCDLYSSTWDALAGLGDRLLNGCVFVFDEWAGYEGADQHEQRAWAEWLEVTGSTAEMIATNGKQAAFSWARGAGIAR